MAAADDGGNGDYGSGYEDGVAGAMNDPAELVLHGQPVTNIFAYGADGKLLQNVQLFDQDGKPLTAVSAEPEGDACANEDCTSIVRPRRLETGQSVFNVFPLANVPTDQNSAPAPGAVAVTPDAPFVKVPAVEVPKEVAKSNE